MRRCADREQQGLAQAKPRIAVIDTTLAHLEYIRATSPDVGCRLRLHISHDALVRDEPSDAIGCVIVNLDMERTGGSGLIQQLRQKGWVAPIIAVSEQADIPTAIQAIRAGADHFVEKPFRNGELLAAVTACLDDYSGLLKEARIRTDLSFKFAGLTPRERQIFSYVAEGYTSQSIASILRISRRTVESYREKVMIKMGAASVPHLVRQAIRLNVLSP